MMSAYLAYVWVADPDLPDVLGRFVDRYVAGDQPNEPRLAPLLRTYVERAPAEGDGAALDELRRDPQAARAFTLYLRATSHTGASITLTEEGDLVLGVGIGTLLDESPEMRAEAERLLGDLLREFDAAAGMLGGEDLAPPHSLCEWVDEEPMLRVGRDPEVGASSAGGARRP